MSAPRVLAYPPRHDYVDRLHPDVADLVHRDDPWPVLPHRYDPGWVRAHTQDWDVAHLHFTWEQHPVPVVAEVLDAMAAAGTPVVWTAHDLRNPHTGEAAADEPYLALLADRADRVLTLTDGAAAEVARRWGRTAEVVPHGPILDPEDAARWRASAARPAGARDGLRLLVHAKSLRAGLDWRAAVDAAELVARERADANIRVTVGVHAHAAGRGDVEATASEVVDVRVHDPLPLDALCATLLDHDALVLPYRWGTHSGLVELAADLGVPVVVSDVGHIREQVPAIVCDPGADGLAEGFRRLLDAGPPPPVPIEERAAALRRFREAHASVYASLAPPG